MTRSNPEWRRLTGDGETGTQQGKRRGQEEVVAFHKNPLRHRELRFFLSKSPNLPTAVEDVPGIVRVRFSQSESGSRKIAIPWRNRGNEVNFVGLSDGGHQLPGPTEGYPFSNIDVLDFLQAH